MSLNMKTLHQAWVKTAAVIEKTVQTTVQDVTGPKPLQDYDLLDQIGSAGPGLVWKLYSAKARSGSALSQQYPTVCVWVLDKKALSEARLRSGLTKSCEDSFLDIIRGDAARLVRLRHPGVVHVVQALDESKNAMAMVTEPLFASVANTLGNVENIEKVPKELKGMEMGLLEVKHGLLQIAESLNFLHNNARLIHRAISPESVLITSSGSWKLGGFGFAVSADQSSGDTADGHGFHYAEYDVEDSVMPLQPCLNYTAPELVRSIATSVGCSSDVFSFGCLAYHLVARKPLFDCHNNVKMYMNTLTYLSSDAFSSIPPELVPDLQKMLSATEASRPTALDFTGSAFFRNDTRLRALRFLDHMLERDNMQKSEFLKALSDMWKDFDSRVLRYKVLPPLCAELRNMVMQPMILPMVLTIAESQDRSDFELSTLPALVPVLSTAAGETLLLLVKHADLVISKASQDHLVSHVLPLLIRAYDDNDARMQEEGLKRTLTLAKKLDIQLVKQGILPKVHGLALKTTVAAVRVNALLCLGDMVNMLDKPAVLEILQTIQRCTAVDHSAPTLMCSLGVANSVLKKYGLEFAAEHVLPLVTPLLIAQQLNVQQFAKYMLFVKDILRKIEEKRGVTLTDGCSEVRQSPAIDGSQPGLKKPVATAVSNSSTKSSWDEDWPATTKGPTANPQSTTTNISSIQPKANQPTPVLSSNFIPPTSSIGSQQNVASCPPVDLEWPPRSSSTTPHLGDLGNHTKNNGSSSGVLDDIDPFANWPPRPSGSPSASGHSNNGTPVSGLGTSPLNGVQFPNSWGFNTVSSIGGLNQNQGSSMGGLNGVGPQNSIGGLNQNQGISMGGLNGVGPQNSIGGLNQNQGISMGGLNGVGPQNSIGGLNQNQGSSAWGSYNEKKTSADIGSIFSSGKSEQNALRLAPPPLTAVGRGRGSVSGRGRGRGRGRQGQQGSGQPPLLDLL